MDDLGLDDDAEGDEGDNGQSNADRAHGQRRLRALVRTQMPRMASVEFLRPGRPPWTVTALLEIGRAACAIEATSDNFATMWEIAGKDLNKGVPSRKPYGTVRSGGDDDLKGER